MREKFHFQTSLARARALFGAYVYISSVWESRSMLYFSFFSHPFPRACVCVCRTLTLDCGTLMEFNSLANLLFRTVWFNIICSAQPILGRMASEDEWACLFAHRKSNTQFKRGVFCSYANIETGSTSNGNNKIAKHRTYFNLELLVCVSISLVDIADQVFPCDTFRGEDKDAWRPFSQH